MLISLGALVFAFAVILNAAESAKRLDEADRKAEELIKRLNALLNSPQGKDLDQ